MSGSFRCEDLIPTPMKTSTTMSRKKRGESIPSFNAGANTGHDFANFMASVGALRPARFALRHRSSKSDNLDDRCLEIWLTAMGLMLTVAFQGFGALSIALAGVFESE